MGPKLPKRSSNRRRLTRLLDSRTPCTMPAQATPRTTAVIPTPQARASAVAASEPRRATSSLLRSMLNRSTSRASRSSRTNGFAARSAGPSSASPGSRLIRPATKSAPLPAVMTTTSRSSVLPSRKARASLSLLRMRSTKPNSSGRRSRRPRAQLRKRSSSGGRLRPPKEQRNEILRKISNSKTR